MVEGRLGDSIGLTEEVIKKACNLAMKAHLKAPEKPFLFDANCTTSDAVFAFSGSWAVNDWYSRNPFGGAKINASMFPSLVSIGIDERAVVNEAFSCRFEKILQKSQFQKEVIFCSINQISNSTSNSMSKNSIPPGNLLKIHWIQKIVGILMKSSFLLSTKIISSMIFIFQ